MTVKYLSMKAVSLANFICHTNERVSLRAVILLGAAALIIITSIPRLGRNVLLLCYFHCLQWRHIPFILSKSANKLQGRVHPHAIC